MAAIDWPAIEGEYRAGKKSVNSIAKEYGTSESTIRSRAKKHGWTRNPAETQREKVKAYFAGVANSVANSAVREIEAAAAVAAAAARAIALEELVLGNAERILCRIRAELEDERVLSSADLKRLSESNALNLATVRTVLTLDDPQEKPLVLEVPERGRELD